MLQGLRHGVATAIQLGLMLLPAGFGIVGCGTVTPTDDNSYGGSHFAYTGSSLEGSIAPAKDETGSGAYFGMTIHRLVYNPLSPGVPPAPFPPFAVHTLGLGGVVNWMSLEPANGQYDWTTLDSTIAVAQQNGVSDFVFTLSDVPQWASTNPSDPCDGNFPGACDPPDMHAFDEFATRLVQRYCGTVRYYETWNEANLASYWRGTNEQLLPIARDLYQIAKDPANCGCNNGVCSPGGGTNPNSVLSPSVSILSQPVLTWLDNYFAAAGSTYPYADIVAFHGYGYAQPEGIVETVPQLEKVLASHGMSGLQLWDTEADWGTSDNDDQQQEASWLLRFHVVQSAAGVSRFIWYAYDNCKWGTLWGSACGNSPDSWQGLRLPGQAYANLEGWLNGAALTHCDYFKDGLWACELVRSGGYEGWMLWSSKGVNLSVALPSALNLRQYRDWRNDVAPVPAELVVDQMPVIVEN